MFFEKKNRQVEEISEPNIKKIRDITYHSQEIIDDKLYDTEKSEIICMTDSGVLFRTAKGNYFLCERDYSLSRDSNDEYSSETWYRNITPIDLDKAKYFIGKSNFTKYIELFGEPELA